MKKEVIKYHVEIIKIVLNYHMSDKSCCYRNKNILSILIEN